MAQDPSHRADRADPHDRGAVPPYARAVLDVVDTVPLGTVVTYGDVAELVGRGGPRQVAAVMARWGHETAWHRVLQADGTCAPIVAERQVPRLRRERVPFTADGRVDLARARWHGPSEPGRP